MRKVLVWSFVVSAAVLVMSWGTQLGAQESLGEKARKIRAAKENAQTASDPANGQKTGQRSAGPTQADVSMTMALISESDPEKYSEGVRLLFTQERFRVLDDVAAGDRGNKTRFAGGEWKLKAFYDAIATPEGRGRGVVSDWNAYRDRLNRWVAQLPQSITARVALAQAELLFAGQVRGTGDPGSVPPERQLLYTQKLKEAEVLLNQASNLLEKCPEWYDVMLQVGRAEGWDLPGLAAVFDQAVALEPQYFYVYQQQALTLMPRWRGKEGDAEKFAEDTANRMGGKPGDILYWLIAQAVIGSPELGKAPQHFVWSRALVGYQGLVEQYGASVVRQNQIAFMAARFGDYMAADDMLAQVGDHWDPGTWGSKGYFDQVKAWASSSAGPFKKIVEAYKAVNVNIATPEGRRYDGQIAKEFSARYARAVQDCHARASGAEPTLLILQVARTGSIQQMLVMPETASDACLRPKLEKANFSPPPKPEYWVRVNLR